MLNPFDLRTALLAQHAQHVVLVHFPIALFVMSVVFDWLSRWTGRRGLQDAGYYNLVGAAISTVPVLVTGVLAWQFQLEGQPLKGILRLHLVSASASAVVIWMTWWLHRRERLGETPDAKYRLGIELAGLILVSMTGNLGGYLSGVNASV
jgi:uncharacterized membrane protein